MTNLCAGPETHLRHLLARVDRAPRGRVVVRQVVARDCTGTRGAASGDTDRVGIEDSRGVFCIMYVRELIVNRIDVS